MVATNQDINPRTPRWWKFLIRLGIAWGLLFTVILTASEPTPENWTLMFAIWGAGLYTLGLRITRKWWLPRLSKHPLRNAILLGAFNAAVIETEFLFFENVFGAQGIAAHPNLLVDLLMTMPWYTLMCLTFVKVQNRWRFSTATVLFLGGIYEVGGDGIVGSLMGVLFGNFQIFTLEYWTLLLLVFGWAFISVYSSMVLPPSWLIATTPAPTERPSGPAWRQALKPMLWLIPFAIYLLIFMLFMSMAELG
ncbi:MAG: hypothetical protein ISR58_01210 [Anaerolineales bacterium]|nr:hypothetical protein [Chloroflexota bacterium]MBL6979783.1 hypothetical protein [Anaerolineales bacterium]